MKHVALYCRVSTSTQKGGLESQIRSLRDYCEKNSIAEFQIYEDEGVSGAKAHRPGLDELMAAVTANQVSRVVVYSFSRFARSTKHLLTALEIFNSLGVGFVSVSESLDTSTPTGRMVFTVLASVAELEREILRERVRNGLINARAKGKQLGRPKQIKNIEVMKLLASQDLSHREIAVLVGCCQTTVSRELRKVESKVAS